MIENIEKIIGTKFRINNNGELRVGTIEDVHIRKNSYVFFMVVEEDSIYVNGVKRYENRFILDRESLPNWKGFYDLSLDGYIDKLGIQTDSLTDMGSFQNKILHFWEYIIECGTKKIK